EAEDRKDHKRSDQRDRYGQKWDERRTPALQEDVNDDDHQDDGDDQRLDDLLDALGDGARRIQCDLVVDSLWKPLSLLFQQLLHALRCLDRVRTWQLVDGDDRARLAVVIALDRVVLRPQFNARDVFYAHDAAIGCGADNDLFKILGCDQASLGAN